MVVDRNLDKVLFPKEELIKCPFPAVKLKHHFKKTLLNWQEIIDIITSHLMNESCKKKFDNETINYQARKIKIKKLDPIENWIKKIFPTQEHDVDLHGSFEPSTGGFRLHNDSESTILHVQKGEVIVNVVTAKVSYVFNLKENDMIYIKNKVHHSVIGLTPRFLTSYGIY